MSRPQRQGLLQLLTVLLAFMLMLFPLPPTMGLMRPFFVALVLIYWSLESPGQVGLGWAFVCGLLADIATGTLLGEHAMRLLVIVYLIQRFRSRLRFFPLWQQAMVVFALLLNDRVVVLMIRGMTSLGLEDWRVWIAPVSGALLWPWLFLLLDDLRFRKRGAES